MAKPLIHPNWDKAPAGITDGFSLEMTAKDIESLREAAPLIPADTPVAVTFLPGEEAEARIAATVAFVNSIDPAQINAAEGREITWSTSANTRVMAGEDFALHQALPQFFFHVTSAYAILRHNGVELVKRDFMGDVPRVKFI